MASAVIIVGAGPVGLTLACILGREGVAVTVYERNPRENTFGWGVVFSEQTLSYLEGKNRENR